MNVKVLKSPSWIGHMSTNEQYFFCTARPSVIRYTPNARGVLHIRITDIDNNQLNKILMGHTSVLPAFREKVCTSLPIRHLQPCYHYYNIGNTGNTMKRR